MFRHLAAAAAKRFLKYSETRDNMKRRANTFAEIDSLLAYSRKGNEVWLEIGAGTRQGKDGWTTLDQNAECDISWDLKNGIPFPNASVSRIYCSHLLEHLSFADINKTLAECLRALLPGGSLSICVPDARRYILAYIEDKQFIDSSQLFKPAICDTGSNIDQVNYIAYMDGHHSYMFDQENLVNILQYAGFVRAAVRDFDRDLDSAERDFESIYAIAFKESHS